MSELLKSRHAFGSVNNIDSALQQGLIDAYDILFLSEGKIGWIDKDGNKVILEDKEQVITVDTLPETGEIGKIYVFDESAHVWNGSEFVNLCKPTDVSALEAEITNKANASDVKEVVSKIGELETEVETKVNAEAVQTMIDDIFQVIEF